MQKPGPGLVFRRSRVAALTGGLLLSLTMGPVASYSPAAGNARTLIEVSGGEVVDAGGYRYHLFTHDGAPGTQSNESLEITGDSISADVLIVAGGGGGGRNRGAGGGAGEVKLLTAEALAAATYTVRVGAGGLGGRASSTGTWTDDEASHGCNGANSTFGSTTVAGGGGGGANPSTGGPWRVVECDETVTDYPIAGGKPSPNGFSGGSGGGGAYTGGLAGASVRLSSGLGNAGGNGSSNRSRAGGGGGAAAAGTAGTDDDSRGNGGAGVTGTVYSAMGAATGAGEQSGTDYYFAGGGGGFFGGVGGLGGGGRSADRILNNGSPNTGGGGGACGAADGLCTGGTGGSGVVIVRYAVPSFTNASTLAAVNRGESLETLVTTGQAVELLAGALPNGVSLSDTGFSGATTTPGTFTFTLRSFEQSDPTIPSHYADREFTVTVNPVAPGQPTITGVSPGTTSATISLTPPADDGGTAITGYEASVDNGTTWVALTQVGSAWRLSDLDDGTNYTALVRAKNAVSAGSASSAASFRTANLPPRQRSRSADVPPPDVVLGPVFRPFTDIATTPPPPDVVAALATEPILRGLQLTPPTNPVATVNGVPTPTQTQTIDQTGLRVTAGRVSVGVQVSDLSQGGVVQSSSGSPELSVMRNQTTLFTGQGVFPGSTVQVFMAFGEQAAELARIPVGPTGSFTGQAALQTPGSNAPLPIGRHVLQLISVDQEGSQTVVDMPINVAQPAPQPEVVLANGAPPTLAPGESLATRAGEPVSVNVTANPENKQTVIDGGDWTMSLMAPGEASQVIENEFGDVLLELPRNEILEVTGGGFMPLTRADIWLFSEPTLLGSVDIDANGQFSLAVNIDGRTVAAGEHTLQLQGVGEDGYVRSANLGVVVSDVGSDATATTEQQSLTWLWWVIGGLGVVVIVAIAIGWWRRGDRTLSN